MTHDCKRNGTTTLFPALYVLTDKVIGQCLHRHEEFLMFLRKIEREIPKGLQAHLICKTRPAESIPRFHMHFTPTSSSWLNLVER